MNLNVESWKEFIIEDYFDVFLSSGDLKLDDCEPGNIPLISSGSTNNGVVGYIDEKGDGKAQIFKANCITVDMFCNAFYQDKDFYAVSHGRVNILCPKFKFNLQIGLFICSLIKKEQFKYSYGRAVYSSEIARMIIKLPSVENGLPDWDFMEQYIKSLNHKPLSTANRGGYGLHTLGVEKWKEFCLGELFSEMYKAEAHVKGEFECYDVLHNNTIRFISRTEMNNGCDCYVLNDKLTGIESGNAISIGDTTATCFYQAEDFVCGDHMVICRADWINKYTALFIISILMLDKQKYSYGRAFKMELISNTMLKLPATSEGTPDWRFMENYMKSLPYGDRI